MKFSNKRQCDSAAMSMERKRDANGTIKRKRDFILQV